MKFTSKRGRRKLEVIDGKKPDRDMGTAELQNKRLLGLTSEPLDIARDRKVINAEQYSAAIHFRWLYTLRFGAPGISAVDMDNYHGGREINMNDESWQVEREREYAMAVEKLRSQGALKIVMNIAIFNHRPGFLAKSSRKGHIYDNKEREKFCLGLEILASLWGPRPAKSLKQL